VAWIHLKCIRCFVEAILRYGLPAEFQASLLMVTHPNILSLSCTQFSKSETILFGSNVNFEQSLAKEETRKEVARHSVAPL